MISNKNAKISTSKPVRTKYIARNQKQLNSMYLINVIQNRFITMTMVTKYKRMHPPYCNLGNGNWNKVKRKK